MSNYTHDKTGITAETEDPRHIVSDCEILTLRWKRHPKGEHRSQEGWSIEGFGVNGYLSFDKGVKMYRWNFSIDHAPYWKDNAMCRLHLENESFNGTAIDFKESVIECHAFMRSLGQYMQRYKYVSQEKCIYGVSSFEHDRKVEV